MACLSQTAAYRERTAMTTRIVYLFPDTNLFIQCKTLEELDWSAWKDYSELRLIVSKPVLREIDHLKKKGNDRVGKRSRSASSMFREIIDSSRDYKLVRPSNPCVKLFVEMQYDFSEALKDRLNYDERDDQLLGTIHRFAEANPDADVRLLTHDTTPMFTAKSLGLRFMAIPDEWLLPPESSEAEKQISSLKSEISRLQKSEPSFEIRSLNSEGNEVELYEGSYIWFKPLTDAEVDSLMQRLQERFPLERDFGVQERAEREKPGAVGHILGMTQEFIPATNEEIAKYRDEAYLQWVDQCRKTLRELSGALQRATPVPTFTFRACNTGRRPAKDALVTLEARGNFAIRPPRPADSDDDAEAGQQKTLQALKLPPPPPPPRGQWRSSDPLGRSLRQFADLQRSIQGSLGMPDFLASRLDAPLRLPIVHPTPHDPNAFYYKPNRPLIPLSAFSLECGQWRHDDREETFPGEMFVPADQDTVNGALICRIQAENLSRSAEKLIPVRIEVLRASAFENAVKLIDALVG